MAVRQCVGNAMPLAGVSHAAFTAAHHTTRASAGWDALDFFALKTRAGFVARADACNSSSTRSAWRNHVPPNLEPQYATSFKKVSREKHKMSSKILLEAYL
jgi:hypothetical protein